MKSAQIAAERETQSTSTAQTYNISDEPFVYQMRDRLSFMPFLGLGLQDPAPEMRRPGGAVSS
jgi:hypothetical protein